MNTLTILVNLIALVLNVLAFVRSRRDRRVAEGLRADAMGLVDRAEAILARRVRAAAIQVVDDATPPALPKELA